MIIGDMPINRIGFGALRLNHRPAAAREASIAVARKAVGLGVNLIDTADAYDLGGNEELLAEALYPYPEGLVIATKGGQAHPGRDWIPLGRPEYLRQQAELSLRRLRLERIDLYQLHRVDPAVPFEDQIGTLQRLREEGKVRHVGLSEVTVEQIERARRITPIVSVQNRYNLTDRASDDVLDYCTGHGIAFLPWLPVARTAPAAKVIADRLGVSRTQVALAWLLHRSPVMVPIPGTSCAEHLAENVAAARIELSTADMAALSSLA
jgi:aryl-alcohol dehydrogenase-like predicted oxidoreductase